MQLATIGRMPMALVAILASAFLSSCSVLSDGYYRSYTASCGTASVAEVRDVLRRMASSISTTVASTAKTTEDRPDSFVVTIDLPLVSGAAPYRPESSGQIILSHSYYGGDNNIGVVVIGGWAKNSQQPLSMSKAVEAELRQLPCSGWKVDTTHSVLF